MQKHFFTVTRRLYSDFQFRDDILNRNRRFRFRKSCELYSKTDSKADAASAASVNCCASYSTCYCTIVSLDGSTIPLLDSQEGQRISTPCLEQWGILLGCASQCSLFALHRAQVLLAAAQSPLLAEKKLASVLIPRLCNSILTAPSSSRHVSLKMPSFMQPVTC